MIKLRAVIIIHSIRQLTLLTKINHTIPASRHWFATLFGISRIYPSKTWLASTAISSGTSHIIWSAIIRRGNNTNAAYKITTSHICHIARAITGKSARAISAA